MKTQSKVISLIHQAQVLGVRMSSEKVRKAFFHPWGLHQLRRVAHHLQRRLESHAKAVYCKGGVC